MPTRLPSLRRPPIGFAHRGARAHAPENTLAGIRDAINSSGAVVNAVTRSGTNKYSGAAVWTIANSALDANTWGNNNDVVNGVWCRTGCLLGPRARPQCLRPRPAVARYLLFDSMSGDARLRYHGPRRN